MPRACYCLGHTLELMFIRRLIISVGSVKSTQLPLQDWRAYTPVAGSVTGRRSSAHSPLQELTSAEGRCITMNTTPSNGQCKSLMAFSFQSEQLGSASRLLSSLRSLAEAVWRLHQSLDCSCYARQDFCGSRWACLRDCFAAMDVVNVFSLSLLERE